MQQACRSIAAQHASNWKCVKPAVHASGFSAWLHNVARIDSFWARRHDSNDHRRAAFAQGLGSKFTASAGNFTVCRQITRSFPASRRATPSGPQHASASIRHDAPPDRVAVRLVLSRRQPPLQSRNSPEFSSHSLGPKDLFSAERVSTFARPSYTGRHPQPASTTSVLRRLSSHVNDRPPAEADQSHPGR